MGCRTAPGGNSWVNKPNSILASACAAYSGGDEIEFSVVSDIPTGAGLGSSSAFSVALVKALSSVEDNQGVANAAIQIEKNAGELSGKQDQFAAALSGFNQWVFSGESTDQQQIILRAESKAELQSHLFVAIADGSRSSSGVVKKVVASFLSKNAKTIASIKELNLLASELSQVVASVDIAALVDLTKRVRNSQDGLHSEVVPASSKRLFSHLHQHHDIEGKMLGGGGEHGSCLLVSKEACLQEIVAEIAFDSGFRMVAVVFGSHVEGYPIVIHSVGFK